MFEPRAMGAIRVVLVLIVRIANFFNVLNDVRSRLNDSATA
jgi:hypothetical protein